MDSLKNGGISFVVLIIIIYGLSIYNYGFTKTTKYISSNIFDEHMAINICMNIGLISLLLGIFFFTYAANVEEIIVKQNTRIGVINIMEAIAPLLNNNIKNDVRNNIKIPDASVEDAEAKKANNVLMNDAFSKLLIVLDIGLTIGFILCIKYKHSFIKVLGLNLIIVTFVGLTEYTFLNFIPKNFISVDTNFIRFTILTKLKSKITINNKKLD
jgi:ABC-type transport system involved in cytochrome bd biosynthesis fused ATPase/permease subunit